MQAPVRVGLREGGDTHLGVNIVCLKEISEHNRCCLTPKGISFLSARRWVCHVANVSQKRLKHQISAAKG